MRKTYAFKAKISKTTEAKALEWLSLCQKVYNLCLEQRIFLWKQRKKSISVYDQINQLPDLKREFFEFKSVNSEVLQNVAERIGAAYQLFFSNLKAKNGLAGKPKYKAISRYKSFTLKKSGWKLDGKYLHVRNIGIFKLYKSREILGDIKQITIKRDSCGDWFVFFSCDNVQKPEYVEFQKENVGLDVGISSFLTDSEGNKITNPRFFVNAQKKLRAKQRKLSRRKKGSICRAKAKRQVAKQHRKIHRQRLDFLFKTARIYVEKHGLIAVENLKVSNMVKNHNLAKHIQDAGWGEFKQILKFKCEEFERLFVEVNPKNTSQKCSSCDSIVKKDLSVRIHDCSGCGLKLDRDHNAAINILNSAVGQTARALT